jgi:hypothetical protein
VTECNVYRNSVNITLLHDTSESKPR